MDVNQCSFSSVLVQFINLWQKSTSKVTIVLCNNSSFAGSFFLPFGGVIHLDNDSCQLKLNNEQRHVLYDHLLKSSLNDDQESVSFKLAVNLKEILLRFSSVIVN